jgi:hypothetical protein
MSKFDAGQGNGRTPERLEATHHRGASAFDRSMILLYEIVEVLITSHLNILPLRILPPQKPKGQWLCKWPSSVILRGHLGKLVDRALRKNACAAAMPRSGRSRKSTVLPYLSTAR